MLSAAEIASIQATANLALVDNCQIARNTVTSTPDGWNQNDQQSAYTPIATVKCLKTTPSPTLLQAAADRLATLTIWRVLFPVGTDVQERDELTINGEKFQAETKVLGSYDMYLSFLVSEKN